MAYDHPMSKNSRVGHQTKKKIGEKRSQMLKRLVCNLLIAWNGLLFFLERFSLYYETAVVDRNFYCSKNSISIQTNNLY